MVQVSRAGNEVEVHFLLPNCVVASRLEASRLLEAIISMLPMFEGIASAVKISEAHCTH